METHLPQSPYCLHHLTIHIVFSREFLVTNAPSDLRSIAYPGGAVALGLLLAARVVSAYWGHIADCDETYNYWEPLHYLGKL